MLFPMKSEEKPKIYLHASKSQEMVLLKLTINFCTFLILKRKKDVSERISVV